MGMITITKNREPVFGVVVDAAAVENIDRDVEKIAASMRDRPDNLAHIHAMDVCESGLAPEGLARGIQKAMVLYFVLHRPSTEPGCPGEVRHHVEAHDFIFDLSREGDRRVGVRAFSHKTGRPDA